MKRLTIFVAFAFAFALAAPALAGKGNNGLSGPHWEIHLIGSKNGTSGDTSGGRAIMIPLKNATGPDEIVCEDSEVILEDDIAPTFQTQEPAGAKLHWVAGGDTEFAITDRDATDGDAWITVPTVLNGDERVLAVDVWVRVHGKPNTCIDIDAFAFDADQGLYFWAGSIDLNRKTGRSTWTNVNSLFDVFFCDVCTQEDVDGGSNCTVGECIAGTSEELSVFNDVFEDYFWSLLNNGTRNVEIRLYPITAN
jgi:hypothetical protein